MLMRSDQDAPRSWPSLARFRIILSSILIGLALAFMVSEACARARTMPPAGELAAEWYVDDSGLWRSIRDDWRYLQGDAKPRSAHHQHR
jgi:hypothetical protein